MHAMADQHDAYLQLSGNDETLITADFDDLVKNASELFSSEFEHTGNEAGFGLEIKVAVDRCDRCKLYYNFHT